MEHEFVPGKRRCRGCGTRMRDIEELDIFMCEPNEPAPPAPEPEKPPQTWHLNVWTDIGLAHFAVAKAITQKDADGLSRRFRLMEEGKGPAAEPLDGVETALVNSLLLLIAEIRSNKPAEETE